MSTIVTDRSRQLSLVCSAVTRTVGLFIIGLIGWFWFASAAGSAWRIALLAAVMALSAVVGIAWYLSRVGAERRWRAAWDAYAKHELDVYAKREPVKEEDSLKEELHARPHAQDR